MRSFLFVLLTSFILLPLLLLPGTIISLESSRIYSYKIFIDPGHGGYDPGSNYDGILEKDINMAIAGRLYEIIVSNGFQAELTRSEDYDLSRTNSNNHKMEDLYKRVEYINKSGANILISLHLNSMVDTSIYGPMVYYRSKDEESYHLAKSIQEELNNFSHLNKIIHQEKYYLFMKTKIPAVLIECGFLSNREERVKLLNEQYQEDIAEIIFNGIYTYTHKIL